MKFRWSEVKEVTWQLGELHISSDVPYLQKTKKKKKTRPGSIETLWVPEVQ